MKFEQKSIGKHKSSFQMWNNAKMIEHAEVMVKGLQVSLK